jgi:hypothetical protein
MHFSACYMEAFYGVRIYFWKTSAASHYTVMCIVSEAGLTACIAWARAVSSYKTVPGWRLFFHTKLERVGKLFIYQTTPGVERWVTMPNSSRMEAIFPYQTRAGWRGGSPCQTFVGQRAASEASYCLDVKNSVLKN